MLIGRPVLWALPVKGQASVRDVLAMLHPELELTMALSGCPSVEESITRRLAQG